MAGFVFHLGRLGRILDAADLHARSAAGLVMLGVGLERDVPRLYGSGSPCSLRVVDMLAMFDEIALSRVRWATRPLVLTSKS